MLAELSEKPSSKKRKTKSEMELTNGESSEHTEKPHLLVATAEPVTAISTPTHQYSTKLGIGV